MHFIKKKTNKYLIVPGFSFLFLFFFPLVETTQSHVWILIASGIPQTAFLKYWQRPPGEGVLVLSSVLLVTAVNTSPVPGDT